MRILVSGGRNFTGKKLLRSVLDEYTYKDDITIIQGGAKGADFIAKTWVKDNYICQEEYKADWDRYYKAAGGIRNQQMLDEGKPDLIIAFPTGGPGTRDMMSRCPKDKLRVIDTR